VGCQFHTLIPFAVKECIEQGTRVIAILFARRWWLKGTVNHLNCLRSRGIHSELKHMRKTLC
jgi:hypothetical protein